MINPVPATIASPVLLDVCFAQVSSALETGLSWLTKAYGKAERRERTRDRSSILYPAIYAGGNDYINMLPDEHLGNYSWFDVVESQEVEWRYRSAHDFKARFGLVFWFDFRTVYPSDHQEKTLEHVKSEVLGVLGSSTLPSTRLRVDQISERVENIYPGYTLHEVDNQFLMRPYGGFRIEGEVTYKAACP